MQNFADVIYFLLPAEELGHEELDAVAGGGISILLAGRQNFLPVGFL